MLSRSLALLPPPSLSLSHTHTEIHAYLLCFKGDRFSFRERNYGAQLFELLLRAAYREGRGSSVLTFLVVFMAAVETGGLTQVSFV